MSTEFSGRVLYQNGVAAPGVQVFVFDQDSPGNTDDNLTITPGLSDATGRFRVIFDPSRYRDYNTFRFPGPLGKLFNPEDDERSIKLPDLSDRYLPFLEFSYVVQDQACTHTVPLDLFQNEFHLPEVQTLGFVPSWHGFQFGNIFSGYPLPLTIPQLPFFLDVPKGYGLCGGMSSAAADFLLAGRKSPASTQAPEAGSRIHQYLFRRQIDSFGRLGQAVVKVARWTALPNEGKRGTFQRSYNEYKKIRARLNRQEPVLLALIYDRASNPAELIHRIWNNHQVLAYRHTQGSDKSVVIHVYDPNYPGNDDVTIEAERIYVPDSTDRDSPDSWGLNCTQKVAGQKVRDVRGIFMMHYQPVEPPADLEHTATA
jgi:hypothetical protein